MRRATNSNHCQASQPMSRQALLAGFLSVWLKNGVVLSLPHDGIFQWHSSLPSSWSTDEPFDCSQRWSVVSSISFGHWWRHFAGRQQQRRQEKSSFFLTMDHTQGGVALHLFDDLVCTSLPNNNQARGRAVRRCPLRTPPSS